MKKYIAIITLIFYACSSNKSNNSTTIPYIFPNKVTSLISDYLINNEDISFFYLSRSNNDWVLTFIKCDGCENDNSWVKSTNRKVYVNRKFYPLVFDSDQKFSIKETGDYLISTDMESFNRQTFLIHNAYHIIFDQNDTVKHYGFGNAP
jgi:hypothetical protein